MGLDFAIFLEKFCYFSMISGSEAGVADTNIQGSPSYTQMGTSEASVSRVMTMVRARDNSPCYIHLK